MYIQSTYFKQQNRTTKLQEAAAAVGGPFCLLCMCSTTPKVRSSSGGDTSIHLASLLRGEFNSVDFWALSNEEVIPF